MKEHPILFSGPMVRALLNIEIGSWPAKAIDASKAFKSQTRRLINPQPIAIGMGESSWGGSRTGWEWKPESLARSWNDDDKDPYRNPDLATCALKCEGPIVEGDHLWVRETFAEPFHRSSDPDSEKPLYAADDDVCLQRQAYFVATRKQLRFTPSIHMPRAFSRITLEVMEVRVQRLQEISEEDAKAEGVILGKHGLWECGEIILGNTTAKAAFSNLWDSIYGAKHPWASNPWVWSYSLKRIK